MKLPLVAALFLSTALPVFAAEPVADATTYFNANITAWLGDPAIVDAVLAQNVRNAGMSADAIDVLDKEWRAEASAASAVQGPLMQTVLTGPAADFLTARMNDSGGVITEVFVMDALGMNVAAATETSDYWQGDEAKFTETYPKGPGAIHVSDVELDESTQTYSLQVSVPLVNPADGSVIGAITVGLNAETL